ncbi:L,D-transpeptidase [Actinomyces israelii]|uniref:L,D-transpeptidase n=1 Tax=Actinomyces israelii TaxID=1659 RepID=A0ABT4I9Q5_9ACTO|nr:L,D-transpeptidase [Actinomyces israelii]MCZ0858472.1 L,D-transpeptidase [Actinomyces israelii]
MAPAEGAGAASDTGLSGLSGLPDSVPPGGFRASSPADPAPAGGFAASEPAPGASTPLPAADFEASAPANLASVVTPAPVAPVHAGRRRLWPIWAAAAALLLMCVGVGSYAYAAHYNGIAVPGTTVAGIDVAGMGRDEIVNAINDKAANATVAISGDTTATASLADLGTAVDAEATADAALARGASVPGRFGALFSGEKIDVVTTTDDSVAAAYATSLIPSDQAVARNAGIVLDEEGTEFRVTPGEEGTSVDTEALKAAAATAAASLSPSSVTVTYETKSPAVSDADAQSVADQANGWISQDVTVTAPAGKAGVAGESTTVEESTYTAEDTAKASWITVTTSESEAPTIGVDSGRVSEWVAAQVKDVNEEPVTGKRNVNSQGKEVAVSVEAVDGREVTNADAISDAIVQALSSGKPYSGTFETKEIKATWEERKIAAGAENLAYQATDGEKWIDINLSNKTVTAYEGATVVHGPVSVVDGAAATPTVTGTYHVYLQYESQTMRGENADGSNYVTEGVPWITYFYQGYALHGAPWRSSFGYSASHGCLNMPVGEAQWFFNWAEVGTTVASHY